MVRTCLALEEVVSICDSLVSEANLGKFDLELRGRDHRSSCTATNDQSIDKIIRQSNPDVAASDRDAVLKTIGASAATIDFNGSIAFQPKLDVVPFETDVARFLLLVEEAWCA